QPHVRKAADLRAVPGRPLRGSKGTRRTVGRNLGPLAAVHKGMRRRVTVAVVFVGGLLLLAAGALLWNRPPPNRTTAQNALSPTQSRTVISHTPTPTPTLRPSLTP